MKRKQYDNIPEEYNQYKRNLATRYGLVFFEKNRPRQSLDHRYYTPAQRISRHKQDDDGDKTLLVVEALRSDPKKVLQLHTVYTLW